MRNQINYCETVEILRGLALEIQDMDEMERLQTLGWVAQMEAEEKGNIFWLMITKYLLVKPEIIPQALASLKSAPNGKKPAKYFSGEKHLDFHFDLLRFLENSNGVAKGLPN